MSIWSRLQVATVVRYLPYVRTVVLYRIGTVALHRESYIVWHSPRRRDQRSRGMSDKLAQSLEDIIASNPGKGKGKGGRGGAIKKAGAGRGARAAAAPYQKPVKASKGVAALSLAELTQMKQPSAMKAEAPAFVLTTGTTIRGPLFFDATVRHFRHGAFFAGYVETSWGHRGVSWGTCGPF